MKEVTIYTDGACRGNGQETSVKGTYWFCLRSERRKSKSEKNG